MARGIPGHLTLRINDFFVFMGVFSLGETRLGQIVVLYSVGLAEKALTVPSSSSASSSPRECPLSVYIPLKLARSFISSFLRTHLVVRGTLLLDRPGEPPLA